MAGVLVDSAGNIYGSTQGGGSFNMGAVFRIDPHGSETVVHNFWGGDGMVPDNPMIPGEAGVFYGTTVYGCASEGGACRHGCGAVFKLDSNGKLTVLYVFSGGSDGGEPDAGVVMDSDGNLYGMTEDGGDLSCGNDLPGCGVVFKLDKNGKETVIHAFTGGADGRQPNGGLVQDQMGNLYGVTLWGGTYDRGTVFKLDNADSFSVVYSFTGGTDGRGPDGPLALDADGNLYGETTFGGYLSSCGSGMYEGCGAVIKLNGAGNETVLYTFTGKADGANHMGGLIR